MTRSQRMTPLARIAEKKQDSAAGELKSSRDELASFRQRLNEVQTYRQEYLDRFARCGESGIPAQQMKEYLQFLTKLDGAVEQMQELISQAQAKCQSRKETWVAHRARSQALDNVVARYRSEELRDELRAGEREADDLTQRKAHKK